MNRTESITNQGMQRSLQINSSAENYRLALFQLKEILLLYAGENDSLSLSLQDWGIEWLILFPENVPLSEDGAIAKAKKQFKVFKGILANPLDPQKALIKKPLFDGEWVWEKRDYGVYCRVCPSGLSPFTRKPFIALPHPFARALLTWVENLPQFGFPTCEEMTTENTFSVVTPFNNNNFSSYQSLLNRNVQPANASGNNQNAVLQLIAYQALAQSAVLQCHAKELENQLATIADESELTVANLRGLLKEEAEKTRESFLRQIKELEVRLEALKNDYRQAANILENQIASLQVLLDQERANTNQNKETLEALENQIAKNRAERDNLHHQHQQQQKELQEFLEGKIVEHVKALEIQRERHQHERNQIILEQTNLRELRQQQFKEQFTTIEKNNSEANNMLNGKLCILQQNIENLSSTLALQENITLKQSQQISKLDQKVLDQAKAYEKLANESHKSGGFCLIM